MQQGPPGGGGAAGAPRGGGRSLLCRKTKKWFCVLWKHPPSTRRAARSHVGTWSQPPPLIQKTDYTSSLGAGWGGRFYHP